MAPLNRLERHRKEQALSKELGPSYKDWHTNSGGLRCCLLG